jgi:hypothetical protein
MKLTLSMTRCLAATALTLAAATFFLATPAEAQPVPIGILNPKFDRNTLMCSPGGGCTQTGITGWIVGPASYVAKFSTTQYPSAPSTGLYCAALGDSTVTGSIFQTSGATVQANTTYTLTVTVGARADVVFTGYLASLVAGNDILVSGAKATPVGGNFVTEVISWESGATPTQLGQPLQVLIESKGTGQVDISDVVLTSTPTTT